MKSSKKIIVGQQQGQGDLYSPEYAVKINTLNQHTTPQNNYTTHEKGTTMVGKGVANDIIRNRMTMVKQRLMDKLAVASVPSDALGNSRLFFESVIKDVTSAAQDITKEALQRIKSHLAHILPSLSPSISSKMVDDAEKEATTIENREDESKDNEETVINYQEHKGKAYVTPASSLLTNFLPFKPNSKL